MKRQVDQNRAVAYLRVSTDDQQLGIEAQRASIERWCAGNCVIIDSWHIDQGISGGAPLADRPGLLDAMAEFTTGSAGLLVVAKRDRLARDVMISAMVERELEKSMARIVSADGAGAGTGPEALLMRRIVDAFAEYERALIRSRIRAAMAVKKARGELVGAVPFGKKIIDGNMVECEQELAVIGQIKKLRDDGVSLRQIVARLNQDGFRSRRGTPYGVTQVARLEKRLVS